MRDKEAQQPIPEIGGMPATIGVTPSTIPPLGPGRRGMLCTMMFIQYFAWGAWFVTLGTYMGSLRDFGAADIGTAFGMQGVGAIIAPLFIGVIADRLISSQIVYGVLHLLSAAVMMWLSTIQHDPRMFINVTLLYFVCYMPTLSLASSITFTSLQSAERQFPAIRAFGTLGWIVAGLLVGSVGGAALTRGPMLLASAASLVLGLFAFTLPDVPPTASKGRLGIAELFGLDIVRSVKSSSFWILIAASTALVVPLAFYYAFANPFLMEIDAVVRIFGHRLEPAAIMTLGQASEFVFILLLPLFLQRLGIKWVMLVGMIAWVVRYLCFAYGFGPGGPVMGLLVLGIALHGVCYDFFFVAGQIYVDRTFPAAQRARAQGLLALMTLGIGQTIGSNFAGGVVQRFTVNGVPDWRSIWVVPAIFAFVVAAAFLLFFQKDQSVVGQGHPIDGIG